MNPKQNSLTKDEIRSKSHILIQDQEEINYPKNVDKNSQKMKDLLSGRNVRITKISLQNKNFSVRNLKPTTQQQPQFNYVLSSYRRSREAANFNELFFKPPTQKEEQNKQTIEKRKNIALNDYEGKQILPFSL